MTAARWRGEGAHYNAALEAPALGASQNQTASLGSTTVRGDGR